MLVNTKSLLEHFDDDIDLIHELLEVFNGSYSETLSKIGKSLEDQNHKDLELHAHTVKGMLSNFFCEKLIQEASSLEKQGRETNILDTASEQLEFLKENIPVMITEIRELK